MNLSIPISAKQPYMTPQEKFQAFDENNPQIYELFKKFAFQAMNKGFCNYSSSGIFEIIRWHTKVKTDDPIFKLSNNHKPHYARKFMADFPKHDGFFRTCRLNGENRDNVKWPAGKREWMK